jgi:hypothetical protein
MSNVHYISPDWKGIYKSYIEYIWKNFKYLMNYLYFCQDSTIPVLKHMILKQFYCFTEFFICFIIRLACGGFWDSRWFKF